MLYLLKYKNWLLDGLYVFFFAEHPLNIITIVYANTCRFDLGGSYCAGDYFLAGTNFDRD